MVVALTDSRDPRQYIQKMKKRDEELKKGGYKLYILLP